ncbi:hypothetical protein [Paenibacillus sp. YYML68]|uniref:hypothetical protein n=1 Tax=Paenibacillus sp. YYML68 TaxID=2909250 RepID=UPI0024932982|nr:hypothetical protein [Paenibacillus sp. YYML68]
MRFQSFTNEKSESFNFAYSFTLGMVNFSVFSNVKEVMKEIEHYIPLTTNSRTMIHYEIRMYINAELNESIRSHCFSGGADVFSKPDFSYKTIVDDDVTLLASNIGFRNSNKHSIIMNGNHIAIVASEESSEIYRTPLRLIREIFLRELENVGGCFTHGAAIAIDEGKSGILIIGDNGVGKTSTMWNLVQQKGVEYISNDRCILHEEQNDIVVYGWPLAIRLGMGTLEHSRLIKEGDSEAIFRRDQASGIWSQKFENEEDALKYWRSMDKLEITPQEMFEFKGVINRGSEKVSAVIFPDLKIGSGEIRLEPIDWDDSLDKILNDNLREPIDEDYLRGFLNIRKVSDEFLIAATAQLIRQLKTKKIWKLSGDPRDLSSKAESIVDTLRSHLGN